MADFPLTLDQVTQRLHCGLTWLRAHLKKHPHYRWAGRRMVFFEEDYKALVASLPKGEVEPCPSNSSNEAPSSTFGARSPEQRLADLLKQLQVKGRQPSARQARSRKAALKP